MNSVFINYWYIFQ